MKILIVEDNEDSRNLLIKQLRTHGHEVLAEPVGLEAWGRPLGRHPNIILAII